MNGSYFYDVTDYNSWLALGQTDDLKILQIFTSICTHVSTVQMIK